MSKPPQDGRNWKNKTEWVGIKIFQPFLKLNKYVSLVQSDYVFHF